MRMQAIVALTGLAVLAGFPAQSLAAETFIPGGHSYGPDSGGLPPLNSAEDRINLEADIIESEINVVQRQRKLQDNEFNRFLYSQSLDGSEYYRWDY
jgi:hypothetical protein